MKKLTLVFLTGACMAQVTHAPAMQSMTTLTIQNENGEVCIKVDGDTVTVWNGCKLHHEFGGKVIRHVVVEEAKSDIP